MSSSVFAEAPGIAGADAHRERRDGRVLRDRQPEDGEGAAEHHQDADDPGEDRPLDEELGHGASLPRAGGRDGVDEGAGPDLLQPLDDDLLAGPDAVGDQPGVADGPVGDDLPAFHLLLGIHDKCNRQALLVAGHAHLGDQERVRVHSLVEPGAHEHAGEQLALRVREERAQHDRAGARVDGDVGELAACRRGRTRGRRR